MQYDRKPRGRLTVDAGLRYEYQQLPDPQNPNPSTEMIPNTNLTLNQATSNLPHDGNNFGPRLGFAYALTDDGKTSVRGGYGLYYGRIINSTIYNALVNTGATGGTTQSQASISPSPATAPVFPNVLASAPAGTGAIQFFGSDFGNPMIHQVDAIVERQISRNTVISGSQVRGSVVYAPRLTSGGVLRKIADGWSIAPIYQYYTGLPYSASVSGSLPNANPADPTIPNNTAGGANGSGGLNRLIALPRNSFSAPNVWNVDLRLSRRFYLKENVRAECLGEAFNVFNRTQITGVNSTAYTVSGPAQNAVLNYSSSFGTTNEAGSTLYRERQIQLGVRFRFQVFWGDGEISHVTVYVDAFKTFRLPSGLLPSEPLKEVVVFVRKILMMTPLVLCIFLGSAFASDPIRLPNGLTITPDATPHSVLLALNPGMPGRPDVTLGQAVTTAMSPDGTRLLVLTSGYNKEGAQKFSEYVFVFDVTAFPPRQMQALPVPNTFCGLAWNPNGQEFYVSGGVDDRVYIFRRASSGNFSRAATVPLGHPRGLGLLSNAPAPMNADAPRPMAAGISVNSSGTAAVVANLYNDSISVIDLKTRKKRAELDLRPGISDKSKTGTAGGEYPYWLAIQGDAKAYVSSPRDREIVAVQLAGRSPSVAKRIPVSGQPNRILLNRAQDRLFVAMDNADAVAIIDTTSDVVLNSINVTAPPAMIQGIHLPKGANPNSLALSPDETTLYVTDGGTNAVAIVTLQPSGAGSVTGLIPTGWYPNSASVSADGKYLFVVNGKSVPGPNTGNCRGDVRADFPDCEKTTNQYVYSLEKASLLSMPLPEPAELAALTQRVAENNRFDRLQGAAADPVMTALRSRIQHVIYIIKENRTYDQVLGDLEVGNGDPSITEFPEPITPNHHALARNFVTLDNFLDSGEVSGVGWNWSVGARTTDYTEKTVPVNYGGRGFDYDWEGTNRNVNVGIGNLAERVKAQPLLNPSPDVPADPNLLPGEADVAAPDALSGEAGTGYLWDETLAAGLTLRNYGIFCDLSRYNNPKTNRGYIPIARDPFTEKVVQAVPTKQSLATHTDPYFRSFDQNNADFFLFREWEREFDQYVANRNLPDLSLVRFPHDHFGSFGTALYGVNTPGLQMADNDYAVGLLAQKIANSPYKDSTLIFVIEDDAQDGPDHMDAHRSIAYVIGPYVKQRTVVSERYTTVNMVRTIETLLGVAPSSLYSAVAAPMTEVFDLNQHDWNYSALVPDLLRSTQLPLPPAAAGGKIVKDTHPASYWQKKLGDMDYDEEDKLDTPRFNREIWKGMMGTKPYPEVRSGEDLRENRRELLQKYGFTVRP